MHEKTTGGAPDEAAMVEPLCDGVRLFIKSAGTVQAWEFDCDMARGLAADLIRACEAAELNIERAARVIMKAAFQ